MRGLEPRKKDGGQRASFAGAVRILPGRRGQQSGKALYFNPQALGMALARSMRSMGRG